MHLPRAGAGLPANGADLAAGGEAYPKRPGPPPALGERERESALARMDGMESVLVSGVQLTEDQARVTIFDLPDRPGHCSAVFTAVAAGGIPVDTIVQNLTAAGKAELSFTVPAAQLGAGAGLHPRGGGGHRPRVPGAG